MLDRKTAPPIREIENLQLPLPRKLILDNGIPLYVLELGTQEVLKLEAVYFAGRPYEDQQLVGRMTARMLKEGTRHRNAEAVAETIDFYGATLSIPINLDTSNIILYSLTKHFESLIPLFSEILHAPLFDSDELETIKRSHLQRLQVDLSKNDVVAYRKITEYIFGESHPYGYNSYPKSYEPITTDILRKHYEKNYTDENCVLFLSGKLKSDTVQLINQHLGQRNKRGRSVASFPPIQYPEPRSVQLHKADSVQTAVRIGRQLWNRKHPDYNALYILNTVLGGYFGSRLMTNIREDKGYTYNIFSSVDSMLHDGYFMIGTEVGNDYVEDTFRQIYHEFEVLKTELISEQELSMVRNYLLGNLMTMLDGAFNVSEVIRTLYVEEVDPSTFDELVQLIKNITPEHLRSLARQYLKEEEMWKVVVGK
ncbi:MAG: pitrilysin family protein [Bacteroidota bacterium]